MVANPARGQLNRGDDFCLSSFAPENLVLRDRFSRPVPSRVSLLISIPRLNLALTHGIPPTFRDGVHTTAIGSVPSSSGHETAYR